MVAWAVPYATDERSLLANSDVEVFTGGGPVVTDAPSSGEPGTAAIPLFSLPRDVQVVGLPHLNVTVTGTGAGTHLFFKLVDREADRVLDLHCLCDVQQLAGLADQTQPRQPPEQVVDQLNKRAGADDSRRSAPFRERNVEQFLPR